MAIIELSYNPYTVETTLTINGRQESDQVQNLL